MKQGSLFCKEQYKYINLIFVILLLGVVILFGTSVFIKLTSGLRFKGIDRNSYTIFKILLGTFIIILLPLGYYIHKRNLKKLDRSLDLPYKLARYKATFIIKLSFIEFLCIFNLIIFFLFSDYYLLIPVSALLLLMLINRPTINTIGNELNLTAEEKERILG